MSIIKQTRSKQYTVSQPFIIFQHLTWKKQHNVCMFNPGLDCMCLNIIQKKKMEQSFFFMYVSGQMDGWIWRKKTMSSPGQTHVRPVHLGEAWHQNPARETSCRCRSPGWSHRQPAVPWHSHLAGKGSCNGVRWAGMGCLGPEWFNKIKHTSASHCNYACSPWAVSHIEIKRRREGERG